jgi:hypothetical protein
MSVKRLTMPKYQTFLNPGSDVCLVSAATVLVLV